MTERLSNMFFLYKNLRGSALRIRSTAVHRKITAAVCVLLGFLCLSTPVLTVRATAEDLQAEAEARKSLPVQSNDIEDWPVGPSIGAESAILMDVDTGVILYAKNIHEKCYPASTTKLLTCLIAMERGNLDDMVTFSRDAVFSVPAGGSNMGIDAGESLTLEQCLYGILVGSANEVANAVGEYVSGSIEDFVALMNERAAELGCTDSHFANTNGLPDDNHYTTAYDLALISCAFFQNEMLCKIGNTARYHFEPTATQPDDFFEKNKHLLITGEIPYEGILGGKTGYTDLARQTLVTCAERNGMKLVCVVFKEESPAQFTDTVELFDYGFNNFQTVNVSENEEKYQIESSGFLQTGSDIFGSSKPILSIDPDSYVIIPNTLSFDELESDIDYSVSEGNHIARINYSCHGTYLGSAYLNAATETAATYEFDTGSAETIDIAVERTQDEPDSSTTIFVNVKKVLLGVLLSAGAVIVLFILRALLANRDKVRRRQNHIRRKQRRRERLRSELDDFDF